MSVSSYGNENKNCAYDVIDFVKQQHHNANYSHQLAQVNKNITPFNKNHFDINKNKNKYGIKFKSIYQQLDDRAKYLEKRHQVMTDLFKRNEELYGTRHYDPVKFWKQQCYNTSRFNQNMLINTIWLQALANRIR